MTTELERIAAGIKNAERRHGSNQLLLDMKALLAVAEAAQRWRLAGIAKAAHRLYEITEQEGVEELLAALAPLLEPADAP
ncbi:MAG: hypothetical protein QNJ94_18615 [Alphaproteobacteria bacterium]|nr:hypothetical protein [Alphaproteobacteria bacterium]